tara:strand:- start:318 stop:686 length:369 start_codon:yes stop_codon:yes gene_type:complete
MGLKISNALVFIVCTVLIGCAPKFGKRYDKNVEVIFHSQNKRIEFYILTLEQNEQLGSDYSDIKKATNLSLLSNLPTRNYTNENTQRIKPGEYVILFDCGNYYSRELVFFEEKHHITLNCSS